MKSFGAYISKHLIVFAVFIIALFFLNVLIFGITFYHIFTDDYGETSPRQILETTASASTPAGVSEEAAQTLQRNQLWAMYLNPEGQCFWSLDLPDEVPKSYTLQDIALFSKGYIADYPVFVWNTDDGLLVLGYPKGSYTKLTSNYYSVQSIQAVPIFVFCTLVVDLFLLFLAYFLSKRRIIKHTEPIMAAIETLSDGKTISLNVPGELAGVANSVNAASQILSRQNEARANWISGVSHDIRTPLSMIMGYAGRISEDKTASSKIREQADIIRQQSVNIKELVQDLNLVSQLEYRMQPLHKAPVRLSKLLRSYVAELLNTKISDAYKIDVDISSDAETAILECDVRLISRAINNLVQNSIQHNPQGCEIKLLLNVSENSLSLTVEDNGCGLSPEKLRDLEEKPHYMESIDERLDLRHGLGLLIVRQVVAAHKGNLMIEASEGCGCKIELLFPKNN